MVIFAQVIMIYFSKYYISLIAESFKEYSSHMNFKHFGKDVQGLKGGKTYAPLFRE